MQWIENVRTVVAYGMIIAKKSDTPPKFEAWLREFVGMLQIEKLRYEIAYLATYRNSAVYGDLSLNTWNCS